MIPFQPRKLVMALATALPSVTSVSALAQKAIPPTAVPSMPATTIPAISVRDLSETRVTARRLNATRNALSPGTGSSIYKLDTDDIARLPLGDVTPLNQVLLQAPDVVQDSYGQLHTRGDHPSLQYRTSDVIVPEPISGFKQMLDARFANQINVLTGTLPAQHDYRTAGTVDITTKGASTDKGGESEAFDSEIGTVLGSNVIHEVNTQIQGMKNRFSYYLSGVFAENNMGIENPTGNRNAMHDYTTQNKSFGMLSCLLDSGSRVSFMSGTSNGRFQTSTRPGLTSKFALDGTTPPAPEALDANQREKTDLQILAYQQKISLRLDYQVSMFRRVSRIDHMPGPIGDLVYNGVVADIVCRNEAHGTQGDASYELTDKHTLCTGMSVQCKHYVTNNTASVFAADASGAQISTTPFIIVDNRSGSGIIFGVHLQDKWKPTDRLTVNYDVCYNRVNIVVNEQ